MAHVPSFLSVVFVVRNHADFLEALLLDATEVVSAMVRDYELIVVDNASTDASIAVLKHLSAETGIANLQVYALTKEVDIDTASWAGLENALGDHVAVIDPMTDDIRYLPKLLDQARQGADVVFVCNEQRPRQGPLYRLAFQVFHWCYHRFNGINLAREAPPYRLMSREVINFILQHPKPVIGYRHLPATGGFARANLRYSQPPRPQPRKRLRDNIDRGVGLLLSTTRGPMRLVTALSLFGAVMNLMYCIYVVAIGVFKTDVAPGWISLSLQQSGMFLLISLVLMVLGEYLMNMASAGQQGPGYHVAQEFTSARVTRRERLNIEEAAAPPLETGTVVTGRFS